MKIFLAGQKFFGQEVFRLLQKLGHEIIGVSCPSLNADREDRLHAQARKYGIKIIEAGQLREETMPDGADLIISAHSYDYIGLKTLAKARLGGIGYHPSLLPLHRGRDAIRWTLRMGDPVTGGTVYWLSKGVDCGPIAAQDWCFVHPSDNETSLWRDKLQPMGLRLFAKVLQDLSNGIIVAVPQDCEVATWEPSLDQPPVFRPDLPRIGNIEGYRVIASDDRHYQGDWKKYAGG